jgi:hypothetical protein
MTWQRRLGVLVREPWIRLCLLFPGSRWRDPLLYAHELVGDDFWILAGRWDSYCKKIAPARIHPRLGWTQGPITAENPRGLVPQTASRLVRDGRRKVLFYGDSYVGGNALEANWLPALLEKQLGDVDVLHLGVGGYGPDQMHLLFKETAPLVDPPHLVVMGLMTFSFDRAAQRVRSYQKPLLALRADGTLEVTNLPIDAEPERFFRKAKLSFASYVLAAERNLQDPHRAGEWGFLEKVAVNRAVVEANQRYAAEIGSRLLYVIFYDHEQLLRPRLRERFFIEELASLGVDTLDTAPVLLNYSREHGIDASELYDNGHHNDLGNQVIAAALAQAIEKRVGARARRA